MYWESFGRVYIPLNTAFLAGKMNEVLFSVVVIVVNYSDIFLRPEEGSFEPSVSFKSSFLPNMGLTILGSNLRHHNVPRNYDMTVCWD